MPKASVYRLAPVQVNLHTSDEDFDQYASEELSQQQQQQHQQQPTQRQTRQTKKPMPLPRKLTRSKYQLQQQQQQQPPPRPPPRYQTSTANDSGQKRQQQQQRQKLASSGYEIGTTNWSISNANQVDASANNPDDEDEEADFDETKLSPFYDGYNTRKLLEKWRDLPPRLTMSDWAFYVKTTRRRSQRSQVDRLVADVCSKVLSMRELVHYSLDSGAHCLLWLNSSLAQRFISGMRKGTHIIGRVQCDVIMKDKQNMSNFLAEHQFKEWIECGPHVCLNEKNEEIKRNLQRICRHQYTGHYMGKCTDEISDKECPNFDYYFCECFRRHIFVPEFFIFSHYYLMEEFLKKYETDEEFKHTTWLAKPAYLTAGKGFFLIRDAREFRYFYLVRSDTCVRREGFVLQRYLTRPCTINSHKIDCRMYLLITVTNGRRVSGFFHPGFVRLASSPWTVKLEQKDKVSGNIFEHLTATELYKLANARMPGESEDDDDDEKKQCIPFNEACEQITTGGKKVKKGEIEVPAAFANEDEGPGGNLPESEFEKFHWRFKYMVEVLCAKLDPVVRDKAGTFQIFGLDILIDSDAKPWLLEVNSHVATEQVYDTSQCRVISNVVTEAICIMCEMFQKSLQEELIAIEIQQGDQRLSKLSRSQRMMTARAEQEALDKLAVILEKTEISKRRPPIFVQNFFWWYDTPRYRWVKPWVLRKRPVRKEVPWYSRVFLGLASRNDAIRRKNFKADEVTAAHDAMDYFRHVFWREKLESDMRRFEVDKLSKRAEMVSSGGASTAGAGAATTAAGSPDQQPKPTGRPSASQPSATGQPEGGGGQPQSASNVATVAADFAAAPRRRRLMHHGGGGIQDHGVAAMMKDFSTDEYQDADQDQDEAAENEIEKEIEASSPTQDEDADIADESQSEPTDDQASTASQSNDTVPELPPPRQRQHHHYQRQQKYRERSSGGRKSTTAATTNATGRIVFKRPEARTEEKKKPKRPEDPLRGLPTASEVLNTAQAEPHFAGVGRHSQRHQRGQTGGGGGGVGGGSGKRRHRARFADE